MLIKPAHSPLGPSSADRWLNCPGSVLLTKDMPDTETTYSMQGTAAHTLAEKCAAESKDAKEFLGTIIPVKRINGAFMDFTVDYEMADSVQQFLDRVIEFPGDAYQEVRVCYDDWVPNGYGTSDDIRIADRVYNGTDYKHGKGHQVFAKENPQLMLYGLGAYHDFKHLYTFEQMNFHVAQPRIGHFDSWSCSLDELLHWADTVVAPTAKIALEPGAPFKAGEWCTFCKAKATCKTRAEQVFEVAIDEFEDLTLLTDPPIVSTVPVQLMTTAELAKCMYLVPMVKKWAADVETHVKEELRNGISVGDWKMVSGRSNRTWIGVTESIEKALKKAGLKVAQIWSKKLESPSKIEKILGKKHPLMAALVHKPEGAPTLAKGSDPRPALAIDALKEFDNLDNEDDADE